MYKYIANEGKLSVDLRWYDSVVFTPVDSIRIPRLA